MATNTTITKTQAQKTQFASNRELICSALGWTLEEHGWFQYRRGIAYLRDYLRNDEFMVNQLIRSRAFWQWWINQWNLRDQHYFLPIPTGRNLAEMRRDYSFLHSITYLNVHPSKAVLEDSYAKMIDEVHKTQVI